MDHRGNWGSDGYSYLTNPRQDHISAPQQTSTLQPQVGDWKNPYYTQPTQSFSSQQSLHLPGAGQSTAPTTSISHYSDAPSSLQAPPSHLSAQQYQHKRPLSRSEGNLRSVLDNYGQPHFTHSARDRLSTLDPPSYSSSKTVPIAIPQMSKGRGVPFMRIHAPMLQQYGIQEREFIDFIDQLNVVSAASPPFKVLDLAGGFIGMVPHHWAQLTSNVMKLAAMGGTAIVSKSRTDAFLSQVNKDLFGSRGLRVRLVTSAALIASIKFPTEKAMALPLMVDVPLHDQPNFHSRLLQGLQGYVSETIPTTLPPTTENHNVLDQMSASQVARDIRGIDKKLLKQSEKQMKKNKKRAGSDKDEANSVSKPERSRSVERKMKKVERNIKKVNKEAAKGLESGKYSAVKVESERSEALMPLEKKMERLLEREAEKVDKSSSKNYGKQSKKNADEKLVEKLLWIFIDPVLDEPDVI
ncbi:hypothetical protein PT974_03056 [Cladobotryum mycophilum]|uniref:Uncharacterized protein n=1 Tax=Cladobotryum mycophilum TaxID=491253 RepID=A0ABR0SX00_9HYPO